MVGSAMDASGAQGLSARDRPRRWNPLLTRLVLRLLLGVGAALCIATGWFAVSAGRTLLRAPAAPLVTTVAAAPDDRWVTLRDVVLDCSTRQPEQRGTLVLANDDTGSRPFVALLAGTEACDTPRPGLVDGAFIGPFTRVFLRERQRLRLPPGEDLRVFSQFQAPRFLRRALVARAVWFGVSLLLTILAIWGLWRSEGPRPAPIVTKSGRPAAGG